MTTASTTWPTGAVETDQPPHSPSIQAPTRHLISDADIQLSTVTGGTGRSPAHVAYIDRTAPRQHARRKKTPPSPECDALTMGATAPSTAPAFTYTLAVVAVTTRPRSASVAVMATSAAMPAARTRRQLPACPPVGSYTRLWEVNATPVPNVDGASTVTHMETVMASGNSTLGHTQPRQARWSQTDPSDAIRSASKVHASTPAAADCTMAFVRQQYPVCALS